MLDYGFYNMDCMDGLKEFPDKYFDLAIVDPPYGISIHKMNFTKSGAKKIGKAYRRDYTGTGSWDSNIPSEDYWKELFRVSKSQIVWGGNYFTEFLKPSKSFIVWDKRTDEKYSNDFADCEYAWCSENLGVARMYRFMWNGFMQGNMKSKEDRFRPTQKPVALYEWILSRYAKDGDIILDTHVGSASSLIACHRTNHKFVGFELDKHYYDLAKKRLDTEMSQMTLFDLGFNPYQE